MVYLSIIICTHKAPDLLDSTLESILNQENLSLLELVLVNNGFSFEREQELHKYLKGKISYKIVHEPKPGLGHARRKGFSSALGDYFILLDDDNTIASDFVDGLLELLTQYPNLGSVCPIVEPVWEVVPPEWLQDFGRLCLSYNACGKFRPPFTTKYWPPHKTQGCIRPPGGGMVISRDVADHYIDAVKEPKRIALSRQPNSLVGCEDEDIFSGVADLGLGVVFSENLKVYHHIPKSRITKKYLIRLNYQMLCSYGSLKSLRCNSNVLNKIHSGVMDFYQDIRSILINTKKHRLHPPFHVFLYLIRSVGYLVGQIGSL